MRALLACALVLAACVPAAAQTVRPPPPDHRTLLEARHHALFQALDRVLTIATRRADRGRVVLWDRIARILRAAAEADVELAFREHALDGIAPQTAREAALAAAVDALRPQVTALLRGLAALSPVPLPPSDTFFAPRPPPMRTGPAVTAAQARLYLRTVPATSLDAMFGVVATVPASGLPRR